MNKTINKEEQYHEVIAMGFSYSAIQLAISNDNLDKVMVLDKAKKIVFCNESFHSFQFPNEKENQEGNIFNPKNDIQLWDRAIEQALNGEFEKFHKSFIEKNTFATLVFTISPIRNSNNKITGCAIFGKNLNDDIVKINYQSKITDYEKLYEQSEIGVLTSLGYGLYECNPVMKKMTGYSTDEINSFGVTHLLHTDERQETSDLMIQLQSGKFDSFSIRRRFIRKNGSQFWGNVSVATVKDEKGSVLTHVAFIKEISEEKRLEQAIIDIELKFEKLFDASPFSILIRKIDESKYLKVNQAFCDLFGYTQEDIKNISREDLNIENYSDLLEDHLNQLMNNEISVFGEEKLLRKKNGETFWAISKRSIIEIDDEQLIIGTIEDISQQKIIEHNLLKSSQKYQDLFENMYDAIVVTDVNGKMVNANKAAERMLGYSSDELKDLFIPDIVYHEDKEKSKLYLDKLISEGFYSGYEGRIVRKDGSIAYIQVNSNAIYDTKGKMIGSRDIVRDISDVKIAEQKREQARKELEEVNQELKEFAYIVSHDLKAPLRHIKSISDWLTEDQKDNLNEEGKTQLEFLKNRVSRLHNFISGIFEYTKVGRTKQKKQLINISEVIHSVLEILNIPNNVTLNLPDDAPLVYAEKIKISQVFQNLISNAIKHNDKSNPIITINHWETSQFEFFSVEDNGHGIEERNFEKIFQIFQTLQPKDTFDSTGIGLTIVKRIIQQHGGQINVKSKIGSGTTFVFTIKK